MMGSLEATKFCRDCGQSRENCERGKAQKVQYLAELRQAGKRDWSEARFPNVHWIPRTGFGDDVEAPRERRPLRG